MKKYFWHILAVVGTLLLTTILYTQKLVPPATKEAANTRQNSEAKAEPSFSIEKFEKEILEGLLAENKQAYTTAKDDAAKAEFWYAKKQPGISAFYLNKVKSTPSNEVADRYAQAYKTTEDSVARQYFADKAIEIYGKVLVNTPNDITAKVGQAEVYVEASENPMQGIQILLEVVKTEPENAKANYSLGLFSMKSGQYDKAIGRFETVAKTQASADVYGYLSEAYEKTGNTPKAIESLEKAKKYIIDPAIQKQIDAYIQKLKQ